MITQEDRNILRDVGRKYLLDIALDSQVLKSKLTFTEHVKLCEFISLLSYEEVVGLTITEDIKDFEGKFSKFLKYSFAAIAGGIIGGVFTGGPAIGMFVLYIFRKLTDTCSRKCLANIPLSTNRKICRYECQVAATRRIVKDLRSEMSKCRVFANPDKCEKSLRKEYIKWSKRLQVQIVKLNKAKLGVEEKARQKRQKELAKRAKALAASFKMPISSVVSLVAEDKKFRKNIPFRQHLRIYDAVKMIKEEVPVIVKPPKIDPKMEKRVRQAMYIGLWILPVPFMNDVVNRLAKKYNFACVTKCAGQKKFSKTLCINQCSYLSAKYTVTMLRKQMGGCNKANKPVKCKKKLLSMIEDWKQREVESKIKFDSKLRSEIRKAKAREGGK